MKGFYTIEVEQPDHSDMSKVIEMLLAGRLKGKVIISDEMVVTPEYNINEGPHPTPDVGADLGVCPPPSGGQSEITA